MPDRLIPMTSDVLIRGAILLVLIAGVLGFAVGQWTMTCGI